MKFGHLENIDHVDFSLPTTHPGTEKILGGKKSRTLNVYIGAATWNHPDFPGKIYPANARDKDLLKYYGSQFNSIELNTTHYRIPDYSTVRKWADAVPPGFKFCPKIPQSISHSDTISQCTPEINEFHRSISGFGDKLGTSFLQLPPTFEPGQLHYLLDFLDRCPIRDLAVELRHPGWFIDTSALNYLCNYLFKNNLSLNITDVAGRRDVLHQRLTNKTVFIRFVANNLHSSDFKRMDDWTERLTEWIESGLEQIYFLIHTNNKGLTPELAVYFIERLNKICASRITPPVIQKPGTEIKLF